MPELISIERTLREEMENLSTRIKSNMQTANQVASGNLIKSMRVESTDFSASLWALDYFENQEKGISPEESRKKDTIFLRNDIFSWSQKKGLNFTNNSERARFSWYAANKQHELGSVLFRKGGRKDIYSNEIPKTIQLITEKVSNIIINTNIIK